MLCINWKYRGGVEFQNHTVHWEKKIKIIRLILLLSFVTVISGCGLIRGGIAHFQSTESFIEMNSSGIFYEDDAKNHAELVSGFYLSAIHAVESKQYKPFKEIAPIYICASKESFSKYSGAPKMARGAVFNGKLFISPRAVETNTLKAILIHELSHLHFHQYVGNRKYASNIPPWFQEGLAVLVSEGGGAESVSVEVAKQSIISGESFKPNDSGSLFFPKTAYSFGLKPHMFYRQSSMFVGYLKENNPVQFKSLVLMLLDNEEFKVAFTKAYGKSIEKSWAEYADEIKT